MTLASSLAPLQPYLELLANWGLSLAGCSLIVASEPAQRLAAALGSEAARPPARRDDE